MLYFLVSLKEIFFPFNLFRYITFRAAYALLTAFVLTLWLLPKFLRWVKRRGIKENVSRWVPERHRTKEGTPTAGGIIILISVVISVILWANLTNSFVWISLFTVVFLGLMGLWDDLKKTNSLEKKGLSAKMKLLSQLILAGVIFFSIRGSYPHEIASSTQFLFFKNLYIPMSYFYPIFMALVFLGSTNAVNLTDGLDGLAAGSTMAPLGVLMVVAYVAGHAKLSSYLNVLHIPQAAELTIFSAALLGSLMGFLWFNSYPAEVFMGDTGSQALGGALAIVAILTKEEFLFAVAGGLFVVEALSVILQVGYFRSSKGKRVFKRAPLHHHFEEIGWAEPKIVVRFWIASMAFSLLALSTLKIR